MRAVPLIPETAPFSAEQRAWLNGFFAGLLGDDAPVNGSAAPGPKPDDAPWHDSSLPLDERLKLAEGRPLQAKLFAAMAQQDCGQCGYLCEAYAAKLASKEETRVNLCVPGGKDTSRALRRFLEDEPLATTAPLAAPAATPADALGYSRDKPVEAIFCSAGRLSNRGSAKDTRHVVLDISDCGVDYAPGDSIGIMPRNDPALADAILAAMRAPADFPIGGKGFRDSLIEDYALSPAPDMLFELISYVAGGDKRKKAKLLAKGGDPDGDADRLDVLAALEKFGPIHPDPEAFLECLEPLQPRLYSVASAPAAAPGEVHLTVDIVRYPADGRLRRGVASTFLAERIEPGARVPIYVQRAHKFALPADPRTPIIMVGPGTGIAPFRAFLWQRKMTGARGRSWLFFGHQHESTDFLYRDEMRGFLADGTLTRLSTAWSRDGASKVYVQHRMREAGAALWQWLKAGAHFYVCGDAKHMAKDVDTALIEIAAACGHMSEPGAREFVVELKAEGRYQADVY